MRNVVLIGYLAAGVFVTYCTLNAIPKVSTIFKVSPTVKCQKTTYYIMSEKRAVCCLAHVPYSGYDKRKNTLAFCDGDESMLIGKEDVFCYDGEKCKDE